MPSSVETWPFWLSARSRGCSWSSGVVTWRSWGSPCGGDMESQEVAVLSQVSPMPLASFPAQWWHGSHGACCMHTGTSHLHSLSFLLASHAPRSLTMPLVPLWCLVVWGGWQDMVGAGAWLELGRGWSWGMVMVGGGSWEKRMM